MGEKKLDIKGCPLSIFRLFLSREPSSSPRLRDCVVRVLLVGFAMVEVVDVLVVVDVDVLEAGGLVDADVIVLETRGSVVVDFFAGTS